jgi:hypothetical protein
MGSVLAVLLAISPRPSPTAVSYSLQAGRCVEEVPPGGTKLRSMLAVGTSARLSATFRFSRLCGRRGHLVPCSAAPLRVTAAGGLTVASVRGTDIQIKARSAGGGEIALRSSKKLFPAVALHAALPVALMARVSSSSIAFPELRALRIAEGGRASVWLYPVDESRSPLCAGGKLALSAPALGMSAGTQWDLARQREVRGVGAPGWSFLDLALGARHLSLPVEIVRGAAITRLELEPHATQTGEIRIAIRTWDEVGEVVGVHVRLWLRGAGSFVEAGHFGGPVIELETNDAEVGVIAAKPGASMILSAQLANGVTGRADLVAPVK